MTEAELRALADRSEIEELLFDVNPRAIVDGGAVQRA